MIDPNIYDDAEFSSLPLSDRYLWIYLLSGPEAYYGCPGLIRAGIASIAEVLRVSTMDVDTGLRRLSERGWIVEDRSHRLIRIPNAPKWSLPAAGQLSAKAIWRWYREWRKIPDCQLKYDQLTSIEAAVMSRGTCSSWKKTFGQLRSPVRDPTKKHTHVFQLPLLVENSSRLVNPDQKSTNTSDPWVDMWSGSGSGGRTENDARGERYEPENGMSREGENGAPPPGAPSEPLSGSFEDRAPSPPLKIVPSHGDSEPLTARGKMRDLDVPTPTQGPDSLECPSAENYTGQYRTPCSAKSTLQSGNTPSRSERIWERLQRNREELGLPRENPSPGQLGRIQQLLEPTGPYSGQDIVDSMDACLYQAKKDERHEWLLNGIDTWNPKIIDRHKSMRTRARRPRLRPEEDLNSVVAQWNAEHQRSRAQ